MLSIGKLGAGQQAYYLAEVAQGREDYYLHAGEAPGEWWGRGAELLGLSDRVAPEAFTALLTGQHPAGEGPLGRATRVPGFDLTLSAPKSVSLLFALGDEATTEAVRAAHDAAVRDALGYLEQSAVFARRGRGGTTRVPGEGMAAGVFRHRTSRAGDPNLHSHVVVANRVFAEGRWSALDGRALYVQAKTAGTLYQASLRAHLRELGLEWTVTPTGLGEVVGVPQTAIREFSQRRRQIEQTMAERGTSGARAAQVATLATRQSKDRSTAVETLAEQWRERAGVVGFGADRLEKLLAEGRTRVAEPAVPATAEEAKRGYRRALDVLSDRLLGPTGLTGQASTFGERDVLRAVATALPEGATVAQVRRLASDLLDDHRVVRLDRCDADPRPGQDLLRAQRGPSRGRLLPLGASETRVTTVELLSVESGLVDTAMRLLSVGAGEVPEAMVANALASRPYLAGDQAAMVRHLCGSGNGIDVVHAAAGTGKTTALAAAVDAWRTAGVPVVGATLSARAAGVLAEETGLPAVTVTRLLLDLRREPLPRGTVLLVDEAGQVGTRTLAALAAEVSGVGGKLVLVGDSRQLPEIDAGGAFRGLVRRLEHPELVENRRQLEAAERDRLAELRDGDVTTAVRSWADAGRIQTGESSEEVRDRLVEDWTQAYLTAHRDWGGGEGVLMLAVTNVEVDDINGRARERLAAAGLLSGPEVELGGRGYRAGDVVVTRDNDYTLGVLNGQRWVVVAAHDEGLDLRSLGAGPAGAAPAGGIVRLPAEYAERGPYTLHHGYALTVQLSQGLTCERAFVLADERITRESGYVALSRARHGTHLYAVTDDAEPESADLPHQRTAAPGDHRTEANLAASLSRSGAEEMALDIA